MTPKLTSGQLLLFIHWQQFLEVKKNWGKKTRGRNLDKPVHVAIWLLLEMVYSLRAEETEENS